MPSFRFFSVFKTSVFSTGLALIALVACSPLQTAQLFTPAKTAQASTSPLAARASATFWQAFHAGQYERLKELRTLLLAAYLEQPRDAELATLLGLAHLWTISERARNAALGPEITDSAILAERYLSEAYRLKPEDGRLPGFIGAIRVALGQIHQDSKLTVDGYYTLLDGVRLYPEFNNFTLSLALSGQDAGSGRFTEAVDAMWQNLEVCTGAVINRAKPDFLEITRQNREFFARAATLSARVRDVCLNSEKVPHNWEGFFLHFGDVLVKQGRIEVAKGIYAQAQLSPTFADYPYKALLEQRLAFTAQPSAATPSELASQSARQCMICHQAR